MRRRTLLKATAGALSLASLVGTAATTAGTGTQSDPYEPLDSVEIEGARDAAVHHDSEIAYVAANDGFAVVDISDPADISVLAERREIDIGGVSLQTLWDIWPWEDRLVVSGPAQPTNDSGRGFVLFDVSDPGNPERVASQETDTYIHNSYFEDGMVYLTGSALFNEDIPLVIYDVTGDEPREVGRWSPVDHDGVWEDVWLGLRVLHDVYVQDGIAYLPYWDAGTWILDVSDPASPEVLDRVGDYSLEELRDIPSTEGRREAGIPPGNSHYAQVNEDGTLLVVGVESWSFERAGEVEGGAGGVDLWDVSDKTDAQHLAHIEPPESFDQQRGKWFTTSHNCDIAGDRLYTSWYFGGVKVHDVSDPGNPEELAWWRDPTEAGFWTAQSATPGEFFVGSSANINDVLEGDNRPATRGALYTFPDRTGQQPDPPDLTQWPEDIFGPDPAATPTQTPADAGTPTPTATADGSSTPTADGSTPTSTANESADDDGPGFGVGGAIAAIGSAGYLLSRRLNGDDSGSDRR
jgi:PGF-CTERM protein